MLLLTELGAVVRRARARGGGAVLEERRRAGSRSVS